MKIVRLEEVRSIKAGPESTILPDGTIVNPEPYVAVNVVLDDGSVVQIEGDPGTLTAGAIRTEITKRPRVKLGAVSEGDVL